MGISLRRFDGWEPREYHDHEYNSAGLLVRTVVTREPEWDDEQRAWPLGLAMREAAECKRCGGVLPETTDPAWSWVPEDPTICYRCVALHEAEKRQVKSPYRAGLLYRVHKRERRKIKKRKRGDG